MRDFAPAPPHAIASALLTGQATPFGTVSNGIDCTSCANGAPGAFIGPITFNLSGISAANFVNTATGYIFAADILKVATGATGFIAGSPGRTPVPEPMTLALFGTGLAGLAAARRRPASASASRGHPRRVPLTLHQTGQSFGVANSIRCPSGSRK